ncbi:hypothetical protein ACF1AJ_17895 [Leifsonia sp. NPDC014704]|uniref:hypothetical protein n=1 Tax=Leifsonia sp. NPDC014704 TaxID=3364123 RepID=UPI0036F45CD0
MIATDAREQVSPTRARLLRVVGSLVLGVVVGLLASYLLAVAVTAPILPGAFVIHPVSLLLTAGIAALSIVVGWRWPVIGLTAGIVVLVLVAFALTGLGWSRSDWASPFNAVAYGAWSAYPTMLGAVLVTVSALRLRSRRTR